MVGSDHDKEAAPEKPVETPSLVEIVAKREIEKAKQKEIAAQYQGGVGVGYRPDPEMEAAYRRQSALTAAISAYGHASSGLDAPNIVEIAKIFETYLKGN